MLTFLNIQMLNHPVNESWAWYIIEHPGLSLAGGGTATQPTISSEHEPKAGIIDFCRSAFGPIDGDAGHGMPAYRRQEETLVVEVGRNFTFCCRVTKLQLMVHHHTFFGHFILN